MKDFFKKTVNSKELLFLACYFFAFLLWQSPGRFNQDVKSDDQVAAYSFLSMDGGDDMGYFAPLRSVFFDGDWDLFNEHAFYHWNKIHEKTGCTKSTWAIGTSVLWSPFYLIAHISEKILKSFGIDTFIPYYYHAIPLYHVIRDPGYSFPYTTMTSIGTIFLLFAGFLILYRVLCKRFEDWIAFITVFSIFFGMEMPYYAFVRNHMSHGCEFFLVATLLYITLKLRDRYDSFKWIILLGIVSGLLVIVRYNTAVFLLLPFVLYVVPESIKLYRREGNGKRKVMMLGLLILAGFLAVLPQLLFLKTTYGNIFEVFGFFQKGYQTTSLDFLHRLPKLLFDTNYGIFVGKIIRTLGIIGLVMFALRYRLEGITYLVLVFIMFAVELKFWPVGSFGHRVLLSSSVFAALGIAQLITFFKKKGKVWFISVIALISLTAVHNYNSLLRMVYQNTFKGFLKNPVRSSSYLSHYLSGTPVMENGISIYFMLLVPIGLFFLLFILLLFPRCIEYLKISSKTRKRIFSALVAVVMLFIIVVDAVSINASKPKSSEENWERFVVRGLWELTDNMFSSKNPEMYWSLADSVSPGRWELAFLRRHNQKDVVPHGEIDKPGIILYNLVSNDNTWNKKCYLYGKLSGKPPLFPVFMRADSPETILFTLYGVIANGYYTDDKRIFIPYAPNLNYVITNEKFSVGASIVSTKKNLVGLYAKVKADNKVHVVVSPLNNKFETGELLAVDSIPNIFKNAYREKRLPVPAQFILGEVGLYIDR